MKNTTYSDVRIELFYALLNNANISTAAKLGLASILEEISVSIGAVNDEEWDAFFADLVGNISDRPDDDDSPE